MPGAAALSLNEREFILQALREGLRVDNRSFDAFRPLGLTFGDEYGVANVQLGKTRVAVRISCDVTTPYADRKFDGIFTINTEFSPMASPEYEVGRPSTDETILSRILEKAVRRSSALDTESLCIIAGSKCFHLRADIHVLDHDGNLVDAACIALVAALQHYRKPDVAVEGEEVKIFSSREREPIPLTLLHHPLCVTVSYFDGGNIAILDANLAEEQVRDGEVVITMNRQGEVCQIAKYGGEPVDALAMIGWTKLAYVKIQEFSKLIQEKLNQDATKRDVGGLIEELRAENAR